MSRVIYIFLYAIICFPGNVYAFTGMIEELSDDFIIKSARMAREARDWNGTLNINLNKKVYLVRNKITVDGDVLVKMGVKKLNIHGDTSSRVKLVGGDMLKMKVGKYGENVKIPVEAGYIPYSIYVNGNKSSRAILPEAWPSMSLKKKESANKSKSYLNVAADVLKALNGMSDSQRDIVSVTVDHGWETSVHKISSIGEEGLYLTPSSRYAFGNWDGIQHVRIDGVLSEKLNPGEWVYSFACNCIIYSPKKSERGTEVDVLIPFTETAFEFRNIGNGSSLDGVNISNIEFYGFGTTLQKNLTSGGQSATSLSALLAVYSSTSISFSNLMVENIEMHAIGLHNSSDVVVSQNVFRNLGGGGVYVYSEKFKDAKNSNIKIVANKFLNIGLVHEGAAAIWIGDIGGVLIEDNLISNTGYSGISLGWVWGYKLSQSNNNVIRFNVLMNIGRRRLSDLGGIYLLGESPGTLVYGNIVNGVFSYDNYAWGGWGIYLDEGSSHLKVFRNVICNTDSEALHIHYGNNNKLYENFLYSGVSGDWIRISKLTRSSGNEFMNNFLLASFDGRYAKPDLFSSFDGDLFILRTSMLRGSSYGERWNLPLGNVVHLSSKSEGNDLSVNFCNRYNVENIRSVMDVNVGM